MLIRKRTLFVFVLIASFIFAAIPTSTSHADTFRPVVRGKRGVVAGGQPLSVEAGLRILQRGGNAVDAGIATIFAASVIEFSHFSFGGEVPILVYDATRGVVEVIAGQGAAPRLATREHFDTKDGIPGSGIESAAVPATLDVLAADEAAEMFRRLAPAAADPSPASEPVGDRVRASTSAGDAAALVAASGRLPLAVALLARLLRRHPGWTVADLLRETRERMLDATTNNQHSIINIQRTERKPWQRNR